MQGRITEAEAILRKIAKFNGKPLAKNFKLSPTQQTDGRGFLGFLELFKTPNLRMKVCKYIFV